LLNCLEMMDAHSDQQNPDMRKQIITTLKEVRAHQSPNVFELIKGDNDKGN
jgi:Trm5-related predicted tRNA methylase